MEFSVNICPNLVYVCKSTHEQSRTQNGLYNTYKKKICDLDDQHQAIKHFMENYKCTRAAPKNQRYRYMAIYMAFFHRKIFHNLSDPSMAHGSN